ncbi:MAG TPA: right-handed parallel beta-helix repeat-containing protein [Caulobacteraceae bacterium]|nr:right-handed parallel beta-helix repeat-containing protein [Caulobacteraceae bacterium]
MTTITVKSVQGLQNALNRAKAGDTIQLAPGTYNAFWIRDVHFSSAVTITSANSADPAVLKGLSVHACSGLTFKDLKFCAVDTTSYFPFTVAGSSNIVLTGLGVYGDAAQLATGKATGLLIRGSSNVTVSNSNFCNLMVGLGQINNNGLTITNNSFHDLHIRGIDGGGSNNVVISYNTIHDIFPTPGGLHADGIQFWTNASNPDGSNIQIIGNSIYRGDGLLFQGIFVRADPKGAHPFSNVTITGNNLAGLDYDGIAVGGVNGLKVSNNIVASYTDRTSEFLIDCSSNVTATGNEASLFKFLACNGLTQSGNEMVLALPVSTADSMPSLANLVVKGTLTNSAAVFAGALSTLSAMSSSATSSSATASEQPLAQVVTAGSHA